MFIYSTNVLLDHTGEVSLHEYFPEDPGVGLFPIQEREPDRLERQKRNVAATQPDLFDRPGLAGLALSEAIVAPSEEGALIDSIDAVGLSPFRFQGWVGKRLTASSVTPPAP